MKTAALCKWAWDCTHSSAPCTQHPPGDKCVLQAHHALCSQSFLPENWEQRASLPCCQGQCEDAMQAVQCTVAFQRLRADRCTQDRLPPANHAAHLAPAPEQWCRTPLHATAASSQSAAKPLETQATLPLIAATHTPGSGARTLHSCAQRGAHPRRPPHAPACALPRWSASCLC